MIRLFVSQRILLWPPCRGRLCTRERDLVIPLPESLAQEARTTPASRDTLLPVNLVQFGCPVIWVWQYACFHGTPQRSCGKMPADRRACDWLPVHFRCEPPLKSFLSA